MNKLQFKKPAKKNIRDVIDNERAIKKAAKESINDQKKITQKAAMLRAEMAR
jgi:hypothetical protein